MKLKLYRFCKILGKFMYVKNNNYKFSISGFFLLLLFASYTMASINHEKNIKSPDVVIHLPWGSGGLYAGGVDPNESAGQGPMSFTINSYGEIFLLDQLNYRVLSFDGDGKFIHETPISNGIFEDIEVLDNGYILLLDRTNRSEVVVFDSYGRELNHWKLIGDGIEEGGLVTAMLWRSDGLWLEYDHEHSVHIVDSNLMPCRREIVKGRISLDTKKSIVASLYGSNSASIAVIDRNSKKTIIEEKVFFDHNLYRIIWLDWDVHGNVYWFFHLVDRDVETDFPIFEEDRAFIFKTDLTKIGGFSSPFVIVPREQFREFRVSPDGDIFQMAFTDEGIKILKWRWE